MPEALACLFVFVVSIVTYVGARIHAANPAYYDLDAERVRLRQYHASLQERLQRAQRENWEPAMVDRIFEELEMTEAQLLQIGASANPPAQAYSESTILTPPATR